MGADCSADGGAEVVADADALCRRCLRNGILPRIPQKHSLVKYACTT